MRYAEVDEDWEGATAAEDCVDGGGWEPSWVDWADCELVVGAGMVLVGVKEERFVAIFCAVRRALTTDSYRALVDAIKVSGGQTILFCNTAPTLGAWKIFSPVI